MRAPLVLSALLFAAVASAQQRTAATPPEPSGVGYSTVGARPRVTVTTAPAAQAVDAGSASATVSVVRSSGSSAPVVTVTTAPAGSREAPTVTITNVPAAARTPAPQGDPDAGVDDPNVPTAGALYGGPLPGPSIAYMGVPVQTRLPPPAPPLAPGAVLPGHSLPGSTPAPPPGSTPWIPWSTSGFQLGPAGNATDTSGYGFQVRQPANPGTLRGTAR